MEGGRSHSLGRGYGLLHHLENKKERRGALEDGERMWGAGLLPMMGFLSRKQPMEEKSKRVVQWGGAGGQFNVGEDSQSGGGENREGEHLPSSDARDLTKGEQTGKNPGDLGGESGDLQAQIDLPSLNEIITEKGNGYGKDFLINGAAGGVFSKELEGQSEIEGDDERKQKNKRVIMGESMCMMGPTKLRNRNEAVEGPIFGPNFPLHKALSQLKLLDKASPRALIRYLHRKERQEQSSLKLLQRLFRVFRQSHVKGRMEV